MNIGKYCKEYRESKGFTLSDLIGHDKIKTLSAFEHGRSTNYHHIELYAKLAHQCGDEIDFTFGLMEVLTNA